VIENWRKTLFLRDQQDLRAKEWLLDIINCIEKIGKTTFTISELYRFEGDLRLIYPSNQHIRAKMRQKLQVLRDTDYLEFLGKGVYRLKAKGLR
jgi:type II restriction enzyme